MELKVSIAEVVDKFTILELKLKYIKDENKLVNIRVEYDYIKAILDKYYPNIMNTEEAMRLSSHNELIWICEEDIRKQEAIRQYDDNFVYLARTIFHANDNRAGVKREINLKYNSEIIEEKSYEKY